MKPEELIEMLRKVQEPKGYFFNSDGERTLELMEALQLNRERYGYMVCPCRIASGDRESDRDIICPCEYREADVKEFGSCYCNLYVSKEWNDGDAPLPAVPERRPAERVR